MENKNENPVSEEQKLEIINEFVRVQSKLVEEIRNSGPSVNGISLVMFIIQIVCISGIMSGLALFVLTTIDKIDLPEGKEILLSFTGIAIFFLLVIFWLTRLVRKRNKFIIDFTFFIKESDFW